MNFNLSAAVCLWSVLKVKHKWQKHQTDCPESLGGPRLWRGLTGGSPSVPSVTVGAHFHVCSFLLNRHWTVLFLGTSREAAGSFSSRSAPAFCWQQAAEYKIWGKMTERFLTAPHPDALLSNSRDGPAAGSSWSFHCKVLFPETSSFAQNRAG